MMKTKKEIGSRPIFALKIKLLKDDLIAYLHAYFGRKKGENRAETGENFIGLRTHLILLDSTNKLIFAFIS